MLLGVLATLLFFHVGRVFAAIKVVCVLNILQMPVSGFRTPDLPGGSGWDAVLIVLWTVQFSARAVVLVVVVNTTVVVVLGTLLRSIVVGFTRTWNSALSSPSIIWKSRIVVWTRVVKRLSTATRPAYLVCSLRSSSREGRLAGAAPYAPRGLLQSPTAGHLDGQVAISC